MHNEILKRVIGYRDYCLKMFNDYPEGTFKEKWLNALDTTNIIIEIIEVVIREKKV